ncbi:MAG: DUF4438 domain-containing protein [Wenzhouxiangellaceae bacterium]|nr:DUF4438 domain-containing protein [Wenzhouxiangellaceae bacterium]
MKNQNFFSTIALSIALTMLAGGASAQQLAPIEYNAGQLVEMAVTGEISPPSVRDTVYRVEADGTVSFMPGVGSITYNFRTGDTAVHMAGNHVEPAVSLYNLGADGDRASSESRALNALSQIGNRATVITGDAKGAQGRVIGKHGGAEHVMVDFDSDVFDDLVIGDQMQIRAHGAGMQLLNVEGVKVMNTSPDLLEALNAAGAGITAEGRLRIGVSHRVPAKIMGSGLGRDQTYTGDYDIQLFDSQTVEEYGLETLRYGDIVAIIDADSSYGRIYRQGAMTIGVVSHGRSESAGHGPGVTTLLTSTVGNIDAFIDPKANLAVLLGIRDDVTFDR